MKQVKVTEFIDGLILEIKEKRENDNWLVTSKQGIVHEAIQALHKKELKK
jgi:hypothetical protein